MRASSRVFTGYSQAVRGTTWGSPRGYSGVRVFIEHPNTLDTPARLRLSRGFPRKRRARGRGVGRVTALDVETVEAIAVRVVELLEAHRALAEPGRMGDAQALASVLGVSRDYVYEHAEELGAVRLGDGPRGRLRFRLDQALVTNVCLSGKRSNLAAGLGSEPKRHHRTQAGLGSSTPLLPIKSVP